MITREAEDAAYAARKKSGARVRDARLLARMSQAELGAKLGEADTFVAAIERGRVVFSKDLVTRLGTALGGSELCWAKSGLSNALLNREGKMTPRLRCRNRNRESARV